MNKQKDSLHRCQVDVYLSLDKLFYLLTKGMYKKLCNFAIFLT